MCFKAKPFFTFCAISGKPHKIQVVEYTEKSQDKHESRHVQLVREYGFHPRSKVQVVDGAVLPRKFEPFPEEMYGRPLEEIDTFIYEEVSKQVSGAIYRFNFYFQCQFRFFWGKK